jgi:hypothetical protein
MIMTAAGRRCARVHRSVAPGNGGGSAPAGLVIIGFPDREADNAE